MTDPTCPDTCPLCGVDLKGDGYPLGHKTDEGNDCPFTWADGYTTNYTPGQGKATWQERGGADWRGEFHVRLFGPREYTAWIEVYGFVCEADSPRSAVAELMRRAGELVDAQPRWRVTVQVGRQPADIGDQDMWVLEGVYDPKGVGA